MNPDPQTLLIHCRRGPYASTLGRAAIDLALAAAIFEQPVLLLFSGDGVWQLVNGQDGSTLGQKTPTRLLESLPLYGIEQLHVDAESLAQRGLDAAALALPARVLDVSQREALLGSADRIFGF